MANDLLKDIQVKQAKQKDKDYYLNDGAGLRLRVAKDGRKIWEFRFTFLGRRLKTTFQTYPIVSLKEAREKRQLFQELINKNINPIEYKIEKKEELEINSNGMFLNIAKEWLDEEAKRVKENTHHTKVRIFENDINPFLKNKHIKDITKNDILQIIRTKEIQAPNIASRIFIFLRGIYNFAIFKGYIEKNIFNNSKDEKKYYLQKLEVKHFSKIVDINILKELVNDIYNYQGMHSVRNALRLVLHLPLRAENLCNLRWEHIDFKNKVLIIPRQEMKVKDKNLPDFKMPLTNEVINILNDQNVFTGYQKWVFLGTSNRGPINTESPNGALKRMGYNDERKGKKQRLHGFRGTFRSLIETLDEDNKFSFEVKEKALDHQEISKVVRAYANKSDYIKQLTSLMNFWSDFILKLLDKTKQ